MYYMYFGADEYVLTEPDVLNRRYEVTRISHGITEPRNTDRGSRSVYLTFVLLNTVIHSVLTPILPILSNTA